MISIIIPCYNVEDYIKECVHSAFAQTYTQIEVICIDNNSSDGTWQKLEQLKQQYPQLIIDKEPKPGAPAARNKGLLLAKGAWIQFLDADDLLLPNKIEHQARLIHDGAAFIVGNYLIKEKEVIQTIKTDSSLSKWVLLSSNSLGITSTNLFNHAVLKQVDGWNTKLKSSQEYDLMFRILQTNPHIVFCDKVDTVIRRTANSISTHKESQYFNLLRRISLTNQILIYCKQLSIDENEAYEIKLSLFGVIRELFFMNRKRLSTALYYKYLGKEFKPRNNIANSKLFVVCHKYFGFYLANLISLIPKKIRA